MCKGKNKYKFDNSWLNKLCPKCGKTFKKHTEGMLCPKKSKYEIINGT